MTNAATFTPASFVWVTDDELRTMSHLGRKNLAESRRVIEFRRDAGIDFSALEAEHATIAANLEEVTAEVCRRSRGIYWSPEIGRFVTIPERDDEEG